jgi:hypothetical protein
MPRDNGTFLIGISRCAHLTFHRLSPHLPIPVAIPAALRQRLAPLLAEGGFVKATTSMSMRRSAAKPIISCRTSTPALFSSSPRGLIVSWSSMHLLVQVGPSDLSLAR